MEDQLSIEKNSNQSQQTCTSCGDSLVFDPEVQNLHCKSCGKKVEITIETGAIKEYDFKSAENTANLDWGSVKRVLHCDSCGAETVVDGSSTTQYCAFCGSSHVVGNQCAAGIAPESLVPFKVNKNSAVENFTNWVKKRFFAPSALKQNYRKQGMQGVYIPFWTYDADTQSNYTGEAGTHYYETVDDWVERDGKKVKETKQVRKTRWRRVSGNFNKHFDDCPVNASKQVDEKLIKNIEPYNFNELVHYQPDFLAGFQAERYSIGLKEGWEKAKDFIKNELYQDIRRHIHADEVRNVNVNTTYNNIKYKHILLPVWISSYTFKDKVYKFMVNGQTGKVYGESPVSWGKVALVAAAVLAVVGIIVVLVM